MRIIVNKNDVEINLYPSQLPSLPSKPQTTLLTSSHLLTLTTSNSVTKSSLLTTSSSTTASSLLTTPSSLTTSALTERRSDIVDWLKEFSLHNLNDLLFSAVLEQRVDIMTWLLEHGADIESRNYVKNTPLLTAVKNRLVVVVKALLKLGANPEALDRKKETPLHFTLKVPTGTTGNDAKQLDSKIKKSQDWEEIAICLLEHKAKPELPNTSFVAEAAYWQWKRLLHHVLTTEEYKPYVASQINHPWRKHEDSLRETSLNALQQCVYKRETEIVKSLLKSKANPNEMYNVNFSMHEDHWISRWDIKRTAPLSIAVANGDTEIITSLLKSKADPNIESELYDIAYYEVDECSDNDESKGKGLRPLHIAAASGKAETVLYAAAIYNKKAVFKLLLAYKAQLGSQHKHYDIPAILKLMDAYPKVSRFGSAELAFWAANDSSRLALEPIRHDLSRWGEELNFSLQSLRTAVSPSELMTKIQQAWQEQPYTFNGLSNVSKGLRQSLTVIDPAFKNQLNFRDSQLRDLFLELNALEEQLVLKQKSNFNFIIETHRLIPFAFKPKRALRINKNFDLFSRTQFQIPDAITHLIFSFLTGLPLKDIPKWMMIVVSLQDSSIEFGKSLPNTKAALQTKPNHYYLTRCILFFKAYNKQQKQEPTSQSAVAIRTGTFS